MIVRSGTAASFPVLFASGHPDANVTWTLSGPDGVVDTGEFIVPADAVSINLRTTAADNQLGSALFSYRDLAWTYEVSGVIFNGEVRYSVEARLALGVSTDGVRRKLGVDVTDLPDSEISLVKAYTKLTRLANVVLPNTLSVIDAVEAQAALDLLPTMTVRVAASEESGTDKYKRQDVDWAAIGNSLNDYVSAGLLELDPLYDPTILFGSLLVLATPTTDAFTGA